MSDQTSDQASINIRPANTSDVEKIIRLSQSVQDALTASGSLQQIGPLESANVEKATSECRCFIAEDNVSRVIGCVFVRPIEADYYAIGHGFEIENFPRPWHFVHSLMLQPELQGRGVGWHLLNGLMRYLEQSGGTLLLDCWAGNYKLRQFYERAEYDFQAVIPENEYEIAVFAKVVALEHRRLEPTSVCD